MNARFILLPFVALLIAAMTCLATQGCGGEPEWHIATSQVIPLARRDDAARFVVECAAAANPKSDEEGEDLVRQCHVTAEDLFGVHVRACIEGPDYAPNRSWPCDRVTTDPCRTMCASGRTQ